MSRILVIEDEKLLSQLYRSALATANHTVVLAQTGEEGVAEALRERPDLIILDLSLPGISGVETAGALHKLGFLPRTPLIVATALGENARPVLDSFAVAALLPKPFKISALQAEVRTALSISAGKLANSNGLGPTAVPPVAL